MSEFETPATVVPADDTPLAEAPTVENVTGPEAPEVGSSQPGEEAPRADAPVVPVVDPVRSAAGRLGARRQQQLIEFGRQYERDHHLTPGRQRLRQLVQLGKRYEQEHGLRAAKPRRKRRGDAWTEFLTALVRVVKPAHRPAVEALVAAMAARENGPAHSGPVGGSELRPVA